MAFSNPGVVIDIGSYCCKAGFSCDNHPVSILRTVVGRPKGLQGFYGKVPYDVYIGDEALSKSKYELHSPVVNGRIVHWDNMERIWHHIFYRELKVAPEERAMIMACASTTTIDEKIKCCEILFETLNAPALCIQSQSVLSMYGSGCTTGISLDLGYDATNIYPVYEGGLLNYGHVETNFSGRQITDYITRKFLKKGIHLDEYEPSFVEDFKRSILCVAPTSPQHCDHLTYRLPSGEVIDVSNEVYASTEMLFHPKVFFGEDTKCISLQEAVANAVNKCDAEILSNLYSAVVPSGGLAAIPGLISRLAYELGQSVKYPINIIESSEPYCLAWLGAAIFAGLEDATKIWVQKNQFDEYGEKIVRTKFI